MYLLAILITVVVIVLVKVCMNKYPKKSGGAGKFTVYGTMGCGWTRKQLDYFKQSGKPFTFVDCEKGDCAGIEAFPTTVGPSGEKTVGFKKF